MKTVNKVFNIITKPIKLDGLRFNWYNFTTKKNVNKVFKSKENTTIFLYHNESLNNKSFYVSILKDYASQFAK